MESQISRDEMLRDLATADASGDKVLAAHIAGLLGGKAPVEPSTTDNVLGAAGSVGHGVLQAAKGAADIPSFLVNSMPRLRTNVPEGAKSIPSGQDVADWVGKLTDLGVYQPQNAFEKYVSRGAEGGASLVNPFGKTGAAAVLLGANSGLAGEAAANAFPSTPVARPAATLSTLGLGTYSALKIPQIVKAIKEYVGTIGEKGLTEAGATAKKASETLGVPTLLSQGTDQSTALSGITNELAKTPQGARIAAIRAAQLPAAEDQVSRFVAQTSPRELNQDTANRVLAAGKEVTYTRPEDAVTRAAGPLYKAAAKDKMPLFAGEGEPSIEQIVKSLLEAEAGRSLTGSKAGKIVNQGINSILGQVAPRAGSSGDLVRPSVTELDRLAREARLGAAAGSTESASEAARMNKTGYEAVASAINKSTKAQSPSLAAGKMIHLSGEDMLIGPTQKGPLGTMFPKSAVDKGTIPMESLAGTFDKLSADDIRKVGTELRAVDPEAFPTIVKKSWMDKQQAAFAPKEGRTPVSAIGDFPTAIAKDRGAFEATVEQLALAKGQDPKVAVENANAFVDALQVIAREQGGKGAVSGLKEAAGSSAVAEFFKRLGIVYPLRWAGVGAEQVTYKHVYEKLVDALTQPGGEKILADIAKFSPTLHRAKNLTRGAASFAIQQQE